MDGVGTFGGEVVAMDHDVDVVLDKEVLVDLVLGFTRARTASRRLLQRAAAGGVAWFVFVYGAFVIAAP